VRISDLTSKSSGRLDLQPPVLVFEDQEFNFESGASVAAVLLINGVCEFRTTQVGGVARGPYCMMGACFDCLVEIDGVPNRQACMTPARDGMRVKRQDHRTFLMDLGG
jgi:predicted molibdopterin-dependent oxidoreductase YjgC